MTIPVSIFLPWLFLILISFIAGGICYLITKYPLNPTLFGWLSWSVIWFFVSSGVYLTKIGLLTWA